MRFCVTDGSERPSCRAASGSGSVARRDRPCCKAGGYPHSGIRAQGEPACPFWKERGQYARVFERLGILELVGQAAVLAQRPALVADDQHWGLTIDMGHRPPPYSRTSVAVDADTIYPVKA
jgi:hypothetical protein